MELKIISLALDFLAAVVGTADDHPLFKLRRCFGSGCRLNFGGPDT